MDYDTLKKKEEELRAKREKLLAECEMYENDISKIQREMAKLDHTKIRLDDSTECMLRNYLDHNKSQNYHELEFYKYHPLLFDNPPEIHVFHQDSIIRIVKFCEHRSVISSLSEHAFDISCEVLGEPHKKYNDGDMDSYTWILRK